MPSLWAALAAVVLLGGALGGGWLYARVLESRYIHALAPAILPQKNQGAVLAQTAFAQPDLLPVYGSSELEIPTPYQASELFQTYPSGFTIVPIGTRGVNPLLMLQKLAAVGSAVHGHKVVISLSPTSFLRRRLDDGTYTGNFSRLQAYALVFSPDLTFPLRQAAARRMLQYPRTLARDPVLQFALQQLTADSPIGPLLYAAIFPLGRLQLLVLTLQDHWATLQLLTHRPPPGPAVAPRPAPLPWPALLAQADQAATQAALGNPFGIDQHLWVTQFQTAAAAQHGTSSDRVLIRTLASSDEWTDLDLLLAGLRDLGARPLILSMPIHGAYYDYLGVSARGRAAYYTRLRQVVGAYAMPLIDFTDHDEDRYFLADPQSHLSPRGWLYYDQALDAFYHDRLAAFPYTGAARPPRPSTALAP